MVGAHERAHVKAFREVLGADAVKRSRFDFRGATENEDRFRRTAVAFEDLAVAAYKSQAPLIQSRAYLVPALAIHTVEARHAAWIRRLAGFTPAPDAFDEPRSKQSTLEGRRGHEVRGHGDAESETAEIHRLTAGLRAATVLVLVAAGALALLSLRGEPAAGPLARAGAQSPRLAPAPAPAFTVGRPVPLRRGRNESRWSPVRRTVSARARPAAGAAVVARLGTRTPERTTNIVAVSPG